MGSEYSCHHRYHGSDAWMRAREDSDVASIGIGFIPFARHARPMANYQARHSDARICGTSGTSCYLPPIQYLATGDSFRSISFSYRVGTATVANIVGEVSKAIWDCLVEDFMPVPTRQDWSAIAEGFLQRWNFLNCLGSIDGKHVVIQAPPPQFRIPVPQLQACIFHRAACCCGCRLPVPDGGCDGGTLNNSLFGEALKDGTLDLPDNCTISGAEHRGLLPHVFVGDEAFPLRVHLLRPFPGSHLTRDRRVY
ncbi:hypothetical protein ACEWY4_003548 [Coilia grayii]|uniref:DDE Tnp4 domain-containing protein n=1 Tax=Coilia grayii TaxID=363190 RepID=A0ABD1KRK6_9TELE